jgi:hypothetical protein
MSKLHVLFAVLPVLALAACAAEESDDSDEDLTRTATTVSLEASDNGAEFNVEQGKKIVVNLGYGEFVAGTPWTVKSAPRALGAPKVTNKVPGCCDRPTAQRLQWKVGPLSQAGETYNVTLEGNHNNTFSFVAHVVARGGARPAALAGAACGGTSRAVCGEGLDCKVLASNDSAGVCRARFEGAGLGQTCAGIAGIRCADGLECGGVANHPDAAGRCVRP